MRLPVALRQKQQRQIREMSAMKNDYFEKLYLKILIEEHDKCIELFSGADGEVSNFAKKSLPVSERHRQKAYELISAIR
jgi:putative membrane protein